MVYCRGGLLYVVSLNDMGASGRKRKEGRDQDHLDPGYCDHKLWMAFKRAESVTIMPNFKADLDSVFETNMRRFLLPYPFLGMISFNS